jgi:hypothetical protein
LAHGKAISGSLPDGGWEVNGFEHTLHQLGYSRTIHDARKRVQSPRFPHCTHQARQQVGIRLAWLGNQLGFQQRRQQAKHSHQGGQVESITQKGIPTLTSFIR